MVKEMTNQNLKKLFLNREHSIGRLDIVISDIDDDRYLSSQKRLLTKEFNHIDKRDKKKASSLFSSFY